jgi:hypothetical protein
MLNSLVAFIICFSCMSAFAEEYSGSAALDKAAKSREWIKLLHFDAELAESEIENQTFFLAKSGRFDLRAELIATIQAFSMPSIDTNSNTHAQCLFPARLMFLTRKLLVADLPVIECGNYTEWLGSEAHGSVSIIYADGYLGNPASFYGHILFKIDSSDDRFNSELLNNSLNFGAQVPDNENPVMYILKGLVGGYTAKYTSNHFYRYNINYSEVELRDLWQYKLNLSDWDKNLLIAHSWELLSSGYTYYFTHRNCAYHLAKMLELVTEQDLISPKEPFVLPITVFSRLAQARTEKGPIIKEVRRTESRQNRFRRKYSQLQQSEQVLVQKWTENEAYNTDFSTFDESSKKRILDVLIDYFEFRSRQDDNLAELKSNKRLVLIERLKLSAGNNPNWQDIELEKPHTSQNPSMLRLSLSQNSFSNTALSIQARPAYYDFLSLDAGRLPNSQLSMMDLAIRIDKNDVQLERLDLLNIESLNISATGLPGDAGLAWKIRVGNERDYLSGQNPSNEYFIETAIGKAYAYKGAVMYGMLEGRVQSPNERSEQILVSPKIGVMIENGNWKIHCNASYPVQLDQSPVNSRLRYGCEQRLSAGPWYDLRVGFQRHFSSEISLSFSYYL